MRNAGRGFERALVATMLLASACSGRADRPAAPQPQVAHTRSPDPRGGEPARSLLYARGSILRRYDLDSGSHSSVARLPSPDVHASPGSGWLASLIDGAPGGTGEEDFAFRPELHLIDAASDRERALGPGVAPLWNAAGSKLAWVRPLGARGCAAESCSGLGEVVVLETSSLERTAITPRGRWGLLAWAGARLLVSNLDDPSEALAAAADEDPHRIAIPPGEIWGASPDGRWIVRVRPNGIELLPASDGAPDGAPVEVRTGSRALAAGSWSPQAEVLAVVALDRALGGVPVTHAALLDPGEATLSRIPGSGGATGAVLWSPDGSSVVFARPAGPHGGRLEAVLCAIDASTSCRELFSWVDDVVLLRLE